MKKILFIFIACICLMIMGCTSNNENTITHKPFKKYEVLLSTKDTIYIDAYRYYTWDNSGMFSAGNTIMYTFEDDIHNILMEIQNAVYVKEIK